VVVESWDFLRVNVGVWIGLLSGLLALPAAADSTSLSQVIADAKSADVVILGEIHDNPVHHDNQAAIVKALQPAALVFEMIPQEAEDEVNALRESGAPPQTLSEALKWGDSGWPDFSNYAAIMAAAPGARIFGAEQLQADVKRATVEGAAGVFGPDAATYGLDKPLPPEEQQAREAMQGAAHCGVLPHEVLPGLVEAQRLRDAGLADAALWARTITGDGQVIVIAGSGHADRVRGVPALMKVAAPDVKVLAVGQFETLPDDAADFDDVLLAPAPPRDDPCAGLKAAEP
jgi:uncharacterized iron-regulated protein